MGELSEWLSDEDLATWLNIDSSGKLCKIARSHTVLATKDHEHLKLHVQVPPVPVLRWEAADKLIDTVASAAEECLWKVLSATHRSRAAVSFLLKHRDKSLDVPENSSSLSDADMQKLIETGFLVPLNLAPRAYIRLFAVLELEKERRRVIGWPRALNTSERALRDKLRQHGADVPFPSASSIRDRIRFKYAAQLDLKKFFQQFRLYTPEFFAVRFGLASYGLSTIATGGVSPPLIAQVLTRSLCIAAVRETGTATTVFYDCMIDNLRLVSDNFYDLSQAWEALLVLIEELGVTVGESQPPHRDCHHYTFLGMEFDHVSKTVQPTEKLLRKLDDAMSLVLMGEMPGRELQAVFGVCLWASQVVDYPLCEVYHIFKFMRRRAKSGLDDSTTRVWPSIIHPWCEWIAELKQSAFVYSKPHNEIAPFHLFTDASDNGWGAVCFTSNGGSVILGDKFNQRESTLHINTKEILAVKKALPLLAPSVPPKTKVHLHIDNTSALSWMKHRRAPRFVANEIVRDVLLCANALEICITDISYVRSADNFADAPSRQQPRP